MTKSKEEFSVELITLDEAYSSAIKVSEKIMKSDFTPEAIVGIARGGMPPARFLCDLLNVNELHSIQVKHYTGGAESKGRAEVMNQSTQSWEGKNILLVDDVNDSGKSLEAAKSVLDDSKNVKIAVLHEKESPQIKADFVGEYLDAWRWIIYQWAAAEDIIDFLAKDEMLDSEVTEMQAFLLKKYKMEVPGAFLSRILKFTSFYE